MMYKNETQKVKQVGFLNAYFKTSTPGVNAEEGVLGLAKDPNFSKNNWIYIFYSPIDTSVNRLSRFEFKNDTLDLTSEKIILQFYSQREICCHTGGSIAFGPDGLLYLSAGDNSTPFNEPGQKFVNNGYAPLNDEPGHLQYAMIFLRATFTQKVLLKPGLRSMYRVTEIHTVSLWIRKTAFYTGEKLALMRPMTASIPEDQGGTTR